MDVTGRNVDRVCYDLKVIRGAYGSLTPEERSQGYIGDLIGRYSAAVAQLDDPVLRRVYELYGVRGLSWDVCAVRLNCDRRTVYRYRLQLLSALAICCAETKPGALGEGETT